MKKLILLLCSFFFIEESVAIAQNLSGTYILLSGNVTLTLILKQEAQGKLTGSLTSTTGAKFIIDGIMQQGVGIGTCVSPQGGSYFEAHPKGNQLLLALIEPDASGKPDYNKIKQLIFTRQGEASPGEDKPQAPITQRGQPTSPTLSKNEIGDPNWGFKFSLPQGWKVDKRPNGAILGHDQIPGIIWIFSHSASSLQELQGQLLQGIEEEHIQLRLTNQLQLLASNILAGMYGGLYQGKQVKARGIGTLSPNRGGAFIIALAYSQNFTAEFSNTADQIARNMQYFQASAPSRMGGGSGDYLMQQMSGNYYSFSSAGLSYSGGTERKVILCPDGTYYSATESSYSAGAGTADAWGIARQGGDRGTWRVRGNVNEGVLTTIGPDGKATEYRYQRCGGDCIYIGNTKFAVSTPANCP